MKKATKNLSIVTISLIGLFLSVKQVRADLISPSPVVVGGMFLIVAGVFIGIIVVISMIIIRAVRKKTNVINGKNIIKK